MQPLLEMQAGIELPSSAQGRGRCSVRAIPSSERVLKTLTWFRRQGRAASAFQAA
jgi:hypothetical protein